MLRLGPLAAALAAALTLPAAASAADPGWTAPQPLGPVTTNLYAVDAAMSPGGDVFVAWSGDDRAARGTATRQSESVVATRRLGGSFSVDHRLGRDVMTIDADASGRAHQAWVDDTGLWLDGVRISTEDTDPFDLDVSPSGNAIVGWRASDGAIRARIRSASGVLGPVQTLAPSGGEDPEVGIADSGEAMVVWQSDSTPWRLYYKVRPAGGAFPATAGEIGSALSTPREPDLAMNARGDAQLVYVNNPGGGATRWGAAHRRAGQASFTQAPSVGEEMTSYEAAVAAIAPNGDGLVAYVGADARVAVRTGDTYDPTPDLLSVDGRRLKATYDGRGTALVGWIELGGATDALRVARRPAGTTSFAAPATMAIGATQPQRLSLAADDAGGAVLAWQAWDGRSTSVNVATYEVRRPPVRTAEVPSPAPAATPTPPAAPATPRATVARTATLTVRGLALTRRDLRFRLSAASRLAVTIERCAPRCKRVRRFTVRGRAGANRVSFGRRRLARGRYRVTIARSGQRAPLATKRLTLKR